MKLHGRLLTLITVLAFSGVVLPAAAQNQQLPTDAQAAAPTDPIRELNLTPEQRQQIRAIRENNRLERAAIGERLRIANAALDEAVNGDNPDESVVEQRLRDVAAAQAAAMRMRILTEIRIRRVLTVQQRETLRFLQHQAQEAKRERLLNDPAAVRQQRREERMNQRNSLGPFAPRRQNQPKP
jgi:Spy/CpxP family protein refolding chaperone